MQRADIKERTVGNVRTYMRTLYAACGLERAHCMQLQALGLERLGGSQPRRWAISCHPSVRRLRLWERQQALNMGQVRPLQRKGVSENISSAKCLFGHFCKTWQISIFLKL